MRISDWSSDVCSSDLDAGRGMKHGFPVQRGRIHRVLAFRADMAGQIEVDAGAPAGFGFDADFALALMHEAENLAEAEARPLAHRVGGEEGFEHAGEDFGRPDRKSTRLNSSHQCSPRMPSSALKKK